MIQYVNDCIIVLIKHMQDNDCSQYNDDIIYNVSLYLSGTSDNSIIRSSDCENLICSITLDLVKDSENYTLTLQAMNDIGKSNTTIYKGMFCKLDTRF